MRIFGWEVVVRRAHKWVRANEGGLAFYCERCGITDEHDVRSRLCTRKGTHRRIASYLGIARSATRKTRPANVPDPLAVTKLAQRMRPKNPGLQAPPEGM